MLCLVHLLVVMELSSLLFTYRLPLGLIPSRSLCLFRGLAPSSLYLHNGPPLEEEASLHTVYVWMTIGVDQTIKRDIFLSLTRSLPQTLLPTSFGTFVVARALPSCTGSISWPT